MAGTANGPETLTTDEICASVSAGWLCGTGACALLPELPFPLDIEVLTAVEFVAGARLVEELVDTLYGAVLLLCGGEVPFPLLFAHETSNRSSYRFPAHTQHQDSCFKKITVFSETVRSKLQLKGEH